MTAADIIRTWAINSVGCPYLYGGTGQMCTPAYRKARAAQYPAYANKIQSNCPRMSGGASSCAGCRWADPDTGKGRPAYDCAQLSRFCMKEAGIALVSGSNSQWSKTAWAVRGPIADMPENQVCLVFRCDNGSANLNKCSMGHVGVYLGDGTVVHAKGHSWGVVREGLNAGNTFTHYAVPQGLEEVRYTAEESVDQAPAALSAPVQAALDAARMALRTLEQALQEERRAAG